MKTTATTARTETAEELAMTAEDAALARFNAALFPAPQPKPAAEARHTPTPWRAGDCGRTVFGPKTAEPSPVTVATTDSTRTTTEEKRANVALIVAAVNAHAGLVARVAELEKLLGEVTLRFHELNPNICPSENAEENSDDENLYLAAKSALAEGVQS
jgi:hypothetical protein